MAGEAAMSEKNVLQAWDYVVFAAMLIISAVIGLYCAFKRGGTQGGTTEEFLIGNRQISAYPIALSLAASFLSAITVIGGPAEVYLYGIMVVIYTIACLFTMTFTCLIYIPLFYRLNIISTYEYINRRFGSAVKYQVSISFLVYMCVYLGIVTYTPALALSEVTGVNLWISMISTGFVCTLYTTLGGIKAVVWTDVFQICIMVAGLLAVLIQGLIYVGGIEKVWRIAERGGRLNFFDFDPDPRRRHTFWTTIFGGTFVWMAIYSCNQAQVQRYLACRSEKEAKKAIFLNWVGMLVISVTACMCGLVMYAVYENCDPMESNRITNTNQLTPLLVLEILSHVPGASGLFIASAFSGTLSTISSGINSIAAVFVEDLIKPNCKSWAHFPERKRTRISKLLAMTFGIATMGMAALTSLFQENVMQLARSIDGLILGPILGVFTLAALFPKSNGKGAFVGMLISCGCSFFLGICSQMYPAAARFTRKLKTSIAGCYISNATTSSPMNGSSFFTTMVRPDKTESMIENVCSLSYGYYTPIGCLITIIIGLLVSMVTGGSKNVEKELIAPIFYTIHEILFRKKPAEPLPETAIELLETTPEKIFITGHHSSNAQNVKSVQPLVPK
ncbi:sodium-coupled monocarboxylate transporter 1-like isoform X1 [Leucoraja erinacea]|uniref:sodium-coupled monocarboxylate transporter 1-like isoform X1 n=1 Tax=Leucoraja erinaceus TaxID=7782 RepID=UPI0024549C74|nr:sodium-coupled monocarboxylate transporter 1-like isoform X1 [Leucoraja erinacea]